MPDEGSGIAGRVKSDIPARVGLRGHGYPIVSEAEGGIEVAPGIVPGADTDIALLPRAASVEAIPWDLACGENHAIRTA